jgi:PAS domain S-box-containing protein
VDCSSAFLDAIAAPIAIFDAASRLVHWNSTLSAATGYTDAELAALPLEELFAEPESLRTAVDDAIEVGRARIDATVVTATGERRVYEFTVTEHDGTADTPSVVCVGHDVTAARRRQRERDRYETVLNALADAVYAIESDGTIVYVNDRYVEMKGVPRAELVGTNIDDWVTDTTVGKAEEMRAALDRGERDVGAVEYEFVTADGERFPAELRFGAVTRPDSDLGRAGMIRDVTERAERERTLRRQNERLDEFASIVSHDLRNPLNVAEGRLSLGREECDSDHLDAVADAHARMRDLIDDLLTLSRQGGMEVTLAAVSLPELVRTCWHAVARPSATLGVETALTVRADERMLRRLLENLLRNCVEHGGTDEQSTTNDTANADAETDDPVGHTDADDCADGTERAGGTDRVDSAGTHANDGDGVVVTVGELDDGFFVEDDGPGIDPESRDRVFDTGYSTTTEGTGFGLRIVADVADAHGWDVRVTDSSDGGARFEIRGVDVE